MSDSVALHCRLVNHLAIFALALGYACRVDAGPLIVFGSSYVDTGNVNNPDSLRPYPWSTPYGETWPGKPAGRYSNGHVLSDLIATALNSPPPTAFALRVSGANVVGALNFAAGGSAVLPGNGFPTISSQIDAFQSVASSLTPAELASAVVLYAPSGDDYLPYLLQKPPVPLQNIYPVTVNVGKQISVDLIRLYELGLRKFAITYLPPTGCLPIATAANFYQSCNDSWSNSVAQPHNLRIFKNVLGLRHYFTAGKIVELDLYAAFSAAQGSSLKPCCLGTTPGSKCSNVGAGGVPDYSVCANPNSQFYWDDMIHPTEAGWQAVVNQLQSSLAQLN